MGNLNIWRLLQRALKVAEEADLLSGESLSLVPQVNDTGSFVVGNGTKDADVKIFLGGDGSYALFDSGAKALTLSGVTATIPGASLSGTSTLTGTLTASGSGYVAEKIIETDVTPLTVGATHYSGTIVLTKAGAQTVNLPTPAAGLAGVRVRVVSTTDQSHVLSCATSDKLITLNNATADSVSCDQAGEKIGAIVEAVCTGSAWAILPIIGTWTITDGA